MRYRPVPGSPLRPPPEHPHGNRHADCSGKHDLPKAHKRRGPGDVAQKDPLYQHSKVRHGHKLAQQLQNLGHIVYGGEHAGNEDAGNAYGEGT